MKNVSAIIIASLIFVGGAIYYFFFYLKNKVSNVTSPNSVTDNPVLSSPPVILPQLTCREADKIVKQIFSKQGGKISYNPTAAGARLDTWGTETDETKVLKKQLADSNFALGFGCPDELETRCINPQVYAMRPKKLTVLEADELAKKIKKEENWINDQPSMTSYNPGTELRGLLYRGGWKFDSDTFVLTKNF